MSCTDKVDNNKPSEACQLLFEEGMCNHNECNGRRKFVILEMRRSICRGGGGTLYKCSI